MTNKELLISRIDLLSEEDLSSLPDAVILMTVQNIMAVKPDCPYCGSHAVIRYGHKCGKQRFFCKSCGKTFIPTTHTIMSNSHFPAEVCLGDVSEFDETFVLDCAIPRKPRKHGAKAEKGESLMNMCIFAQAFSVKGMQLPPLSTAQNPA